MVDPLEETFRVDAGCSAKAAAILAILARERLPAIVGTAEDAPEDLAVRLRDPRVFGRFIEPLLRSRDLDAPTKVRLAERAFDLLPLPRTEADVILVEARAPGRLLAIADFLLAARAFTILHAMHLVYAVFLDRGLVIGVGRATRSRVLRGILAQADVSTSLRTLYAAMHLASVPEPEAGPEMRHLLDSSGLSETIREGLATAAAMPDGGVSTFALLAQKEDLLPARADEIDLLANVPRLGESLADIGKKWLVDRGRTP